MMFSHSRVAYFKRNAARIRCLTTQNQEIIPNENWKLKLNSLLESFTSGQEKFQQVQLFDSKKISMEKSMKFPIEIVEPVPPELESLPRYTDERPKLILGRLVEIKQQIFVQLTYRCMTKDIVKNYPLSSVAVVFEDIIQRYQFDKLLIRSNSTYYEYRSKNTSNIWKFRKYPNKQSSNEETCDLQHDRSKSVIIKASEPFFFELGITGKDQRVLPTMVDKYKQIQHFISILDSHNDGIQQPKKILDMGCGMGYLTFALHHYYSNIKGIEDIETTGVETKFQLVNKTNAIANKLDMKNLKFVHNEISLLPKEDTDILVALHACDTATDDAIYHGIQCSAKLMLLSPCCQKELRRQIDDSYKSYDEITKNIFQHGIYRERMTDILTDTLRGLILEYCGYTTQIVEFIDNLHTTKNTLLIATKKETASFDNSAQRVKILELCTKYGIKSQKLLKLLDIQPSEINSDPLPRKRSAFPPL